MSSIYGNVSANVFPTLRIVVNTFESGHTNKSNRRIVDINPEIEYNIVVYNRETSSLESYDCRVVGYTIDKVKEFNSFIEAANTTYEVSQIKIDCSSEERSRLKNILVADIRNIKVLDDGQINPVEPKIETFI